MGPRQIMGVFVLATLIGLSLANALLTAGSPWKTIPNQANESHVMKLACINGAAIAASVVFGAFQAAAQAIIRSDIQSSYPGAMTHLGVLDRPLERRPAAISGAHIQVKFQELCAVVPHLERLDVASSGPTQAARARPSQWTGNEVAFAPFASEPSGPSFGEHPAWIRFGGGRQLMDEADDAYGIKSWLCHIVTPEALVSFRKEIKAVGGILPALEGGTIGKTLRQINAQQGMMLTNDRERTDKVQLVVRRSNTLENEYLRGRSSSSMARERRACMSGEAAGNTIQYQGVALDPAKVCMAWNERAARNEATLGAGSGIGVLGAYEQIANSKGYQTRDVIGAALLADVVRFIGRNPNQAPISDNVLTLPNGQTLTIPSGRAYDAGFSEGYLRMEAGQQLPARPLQNIPQQQLEAYVRACIGNSSLNIGTCRTVGLEHVQRVVTPANAQNQGPAVRR
jgi:hypothetical protein